VARLLINDPGSSPRPNTLKQKVQNGGKKKKKGCLENAKTSARAELSKPSPTKRLASVGGSNTPTLSFAGKNA
jgi:hypothetical protein